MKQLPEDRDVAEQLARVRARVLEATHHVRSPRRSTTFRTTRNLLVAGVAIAGLTGGAVIVALAPSSDIAETVTCYEEPNLDSSSQDMQVAGSEGDDLQVTPVERCSSLWRIGRLGQEETPQDPNDANFPVPPLVACEEQNGVAAVFPRESETASDRELCEALGLAVWDSD